ncbi:hypothetical protein AMECASPLE_018602 [Ameca splendens]|uniref:Uncharacterized protein n=1 Tax=Ameca splendens TaxID=208324 RepID=A0ABV0XRU8_9TELE
MNRWQERGRKSPEHSGRKAGKGHRKSRVSVWLGIKRRQLKANLSHLNWHTMLLRTWLKSKQNGRLLKQNAHAKIASCKTPTDADRQMCEEEKGMSRMHAQS